MTTPINRFPTILLVMTLLAGLLSCTPRNTAVEPAMLSTQPQADNANANQENQAPSLDNPPAGQMALADPTAGLATMRAYRATLRQAYSGEAGSWSETYTLTVDHASSTRWLAYSKENEKKMALYPAMFGRVGDVSYWQFEPTDPCVTNFVDEENYPLPEIPELAGMLTPVKGMQPEGRPETLNGLQVQAYRMLPESFGDQAPGRLEGRLWLALDGGAVVRYELSVQAGKEIAHGAAGTYTWEYSQGPLDAGSAANPPPGCPPSLPELPLLEGADELERFPNFLGYAAPVDSLGVIEFYSTTLTALGFSPTGIATGNSLAASARFEKDDVLVVVRADGENPARAQIRSRSASQVLAGPPPRPTPTPGASTNSAERVAQALTLLLGSGDAPSTFASYHLELNDQSPAWNETAGQAGSQTMLISANVEGANIHFNENITMTDGTVKTGEVYRMGENEYVVRNGAVEPGSGFSSLNWLTWPLGPIIITGSAASAAQLAGQEQVNGRTTDVYTFENVDTSLLLSMMGGFGPSIYSTSGKIWIDQETGALLKLSAQYQAGMKTLSGEEKGRAEGQVEIEVSQVGGVTVQLP